MKQVRVEICVTAFVHVGEGLSEGLPPEACPFHDTEIIVKRVANIDGGNIHAITKATATSLLAGIAGVLPDKVAHGAKNL